MSENKNYDHKFVFAWKGDVLDFTFETEGKIKTNKTFSFNNNEKKDDVISPLSPEPLLLNEYMHDYKTTDLVSIINSEDINKPTVRIDIPNEMPQIASLEVEKIVSTINNYSEEPQVKIKLNDATVKTPENSVFEVIKTPEGTSDVVVAMSPETKEYLKNLEIDDSIQKAVDLTSNFPKLPDLSSNSEKDVIPQVVQMMVEDKTVHLVDVSHDVPKEATILPVETSSNMPNILIVIDEKTKEKFKKMGLKPEEELSKFIKNNKNIEISTVPWVKSEDIQKTFKDPNVTDMSVMSRRWTNKSYLTE